MKAALTTIALAASTCAASALSYEKDILPIFEERCFNCHGNGKHKGSVNLDPTDIGRIIGKSPRHIRPGDHTQSVLYEVLTYEDDNDTRMPPPKEGPPLTASEKKKIREWIDAGAPVEALGTVADTTKPAEKKNTPLQLTNKSGNTITATVLKIADGKALLKLANGRTYNYPIADLDEESQTRLAGLGLK